MKKNRTVFKFNLILGVTTILISLSTIVLAACPPHNIVRGSYYSNGSAGHSRITSCSKCGYSVTNRFDHNYGGWIQSSQPTCTEYGRQYRRCSSCGYKTWVRFGYPSHSWSGWRSDKNSHWKSCSKCGDTKDSGGHYDNNIDGYCDACSYLMAIPGAATISGAVKVKEGEPASFKISVTRGTPPITYQWYYNKSNSTSGGTIVPGETTTSLSIPVTTKDMDGRYYYCAMTNKAGTHYSPTALLTVWYPFTIGTQPDDINLKKDETGTFSVGIGTPGNPNSYTYQWYRAATESGTFSKIQGATNSSYSIKPTKNIHEEYYYCIVNNGYYTATTRKAKLVADITVPDIIMGSFNQNIIINDLVTVKIPFTVSDTGEGYVENNNFTASDIVVKVGETTNTNVSKTLVYNGSSGNNYSYELTLSNITGNGKLSIEVPADSVKDNFQNGNDLEVFSTNVMIDNTEPKISIDSVVSGINNKYANVEDEIVIRIAVTEAVGMTTSEFTIDDIIIKVGANTKGAEVNKKLEYTERIGNNYIYTLTMSGLTGDGELSLDIPADCMRDLGNNPNIDTSLEVKNSDGAQILIDNTAPEIQSLSTKLGGYDSSRDYPDSIEEHHQKWSKEDIYVKLTATDDQMIDYYMKSVGNNTSYQKITTYQEVISESVGTIVYYKVVDMAGNSTEISKEIKLDKITPDKPVMLLYEQRIYGAPYVFDANLAIDKSVYVLPDVNTIIDAGNVQSGISKDIQYTYYTITGYKDITKAETKGEVLKFAWDEGFLIKESGYYEIQMTMEDIAGNRVVSDIYQVYVDKRAENTIRITNINDIGSGIKMVTIKIYKGDEAGNKTSEEAITPIVIEEPYKEIIQNVRLGDGTFYVEVTLEDKVGLKTVLKQTIVNKL